jgi:hypothetical protein
MFSVLYFSLSADIRHNNYVSALHNTFGTLQVVSSTFLYKILDKKNSG